MYERRDLKPLDSADFLHRLFRHFALSASMLVFSIVLGMLGYWYFEGLGAVDGFLNSAMLLGGMGPVNPLETTAGKLFASFYALYSGMVFLIIAGVMLAPVFHRFLHRFHLDMDDENSSSDG